MNKKNILIHAINWIWLWHIKRTVLIANELKKLDEIWEIIFVTNSKNPFLIENNWFKVESLNYWIEDTLKEISFDEYEEKNFQKLNEIINKNNIDIIIHDTYFIKNILKNRKDLKHFLILRDSEIDYLESVKDYLYSFKSIFIPHIKEELNKEKQSFYSSLNNVFYTWYVIENIEKTEEKNNKILISPGYGWDYENTAYFFEYINNLLILNKEIINWYEVEFILWKHFDKLKTEINFSNNFKLHKFVNNLSEKIWEYEIFIWRAWYNTINEIVLNNTKSLIFSVERFAENQENRINFFINNFNLNFIKKWEFNEKFDTKKMKELFLQKDLFSSFSEDCFSWIENIVKEIKREINKENILIFKHIFLPRSENFIFEELSRFSNINPIILTLKKEDNFQNSFEIINNSIFNELLDFDYPKIKNKELYIKFLKYIISLIKKYEIKGIYTEFLFDAYFVYKLKSIFRDIKIFSSWRWFDVYTFLENSYINKSDFFSNLTQIFVRDKFMKEHILSYWWDQVDVIRSVLKLEKYKFLTKNFSKLDLLIWWRFTEKKNLLNLLDLVKILNEKWILWKIWIVWDGELKSEIIKKINELNLWNIIKFHWFLKHNDLINTIKEYNCFINYSKKAENGDDEWIPNLLLENILSGNLSFSTITGWIWELFNEKHTCSLTWNIYKDSEKIFEIFKDSEKIKDLTEENNKKVRQIYDKKNSILKLENKLLNDE